MQRQENCKKNLYVVDQTGCCIPFKGAIQMQMYRVCIQIWVKMYLNLKYFSKYIL